MARNPVWSEHVHVHVHVHEEERDTRILVYFYKLLPFRLAQFPYLIRKLLVFKKVT